METTAALMQGWDRTTFFRIKLSENIDRPGEVFNRVVTLIKGDPDSHLFGRPGEWRDRKSSIHFALPELMDTRHKKEIAVDYSALENANFFLEYNKLGANGRTELNQYPIKVNREGLLFLKDHVYCLKIMQKAPGVLVGKWAIKPMSEHGAKLISEIPPKNDWVQILVQRALLRLTPLSSCPRFEDFSESPPDVLVSCLGRDEKEVESIVNQFSSDLSKGCFQIQQLLENLILVANLQSRINQIKEEIFKRKLQIPQELKIDKDWGEILVQNVMSHLLPLTCRPPVENSSYFSRVEIVQRLIYYEQRIQKIVEESITYLTHSCFSKNGPQIPENLLDHLKRVVMFQNEINQARADIAIRDSKDREKNSQI